MYAVLANSLQRLQISLQNLKLWLYSTSPKSGKAAAADGKHVRPGDESPSDNYTPSADEFPVYPPPPPRSILSNPGQHWDVVAKRRYAAPKGIFEDFPLFTLYRLYEFIVMDEHIEYRNTLEYFWRHREWSVADIPDPQDDDPERYAVLAGCTYLIVRSFNERVQLGLRRDNPPLLSPEEVEAARNVPSHLRPWEKVPEWAEKVEPLKDTLMIPTHDGEILKNKDDPRADPDFMAKNILLWEPHISFT